VIATRGRPVVHDRAHVLAAAREVAAERGFASLRFADVSLASGVAVSSLQYLFGSRARLVAEVVKAGVAEEIQRLEAVAAAEPDPWRRVRELVAEAIGTDEAERRTAWLLWLEYWRAAQHDEQLRADYVEVARRWRALLETAVDDGVAGGRFDLAQPAAEVAAAIVAVMDGVLLQVDVGDDAFDGARGIRVAQESARRLLGVSR